LVLLALRAFVVRVDGVRLVEVWTNQNCRLEICRVELSNSRQHSETPSTHLFYSNPVILGYTYGIVAIG
jgi:hypothetical protein